MSDTKVKSRKGFFLKSAVFIAIIIAIRLFQQNGIVEGVAPAFIAQSMAGNRIDVPVNDVEKKATLIHFWAIWCGICTIENPSIQNIVSNGKYSVANIAWQSGSNTSLINYAKKNNLDLATLINDSKGVLAQQYGIKATPTSIIVDKEGNIVFTEVGYTTEIGLRLRLWWASI